MHAILLPCTSHCLLAVANSTARRWHLYFSQICSLDLYGKQIYIVACTQFSEILTYCTRMGQWKLYLWKS
jgi:hypothetical protein